VLASLTLGAVLSGPVEGQLATNLVYTAVPPCRLVDSRSGPQAGPLSPGVVHAFDVAPGPNVAAQGGNPSGCRIPGYGGLPPSIPRVQALMLNLVAVAPQGPGHVTAWAEGPAPQASVLNFAAVPGLNIANGVVVPVAQDATPGGDFLVQAAISATHLVIDVLGYFARTPPLAGLGAPGADISGAGVDPQVFELCTGPTGLRFGLSGIMVEWEDAPAACRAGFWVCSPEERGTAACDTTRLDTSCDALSCVGDCINYPGEAHRGWTSQLAGRFDAEQRSETGSAEDEDRCNRAPVWCCTF
jgi:hypothetical protein